MGNVVAPDNLDAWINCSTLYKWLAIHYVDGLIFNGFGHINGQGSPWWDNGNVSNISYKRRLIAPLSIELLGFVAFGSLSIKIDKILF